MSMVPGIIQVVRDAFRKQALYEKIGDDENTIALIEQAFAEADEHLDKGVEGLFTSQDVAEYRQLLAL